MFGEDTTMAARKQRQFDSAIERDGRSTHPHKVVVVLHPSLSLSHTIIEYISITQFGLPQTSAQHINVLR